MKIILILLLLIIINNILNEYGLPIKLSLIGRVNDAVQII